MTTQHIQRSYRSLLDVGLYEVSTLLNIFYSLRVSVLVLYMINHCNVLRLSESTHTYIHTLYVNVIACLASFISLETSSRRISFLTRAVLDRDMSVHT